MITLTPLAAEKVKIHLKNRGKGLGIRIGIKTTGCSGLAYILEFVDQFSDSDVRFISEDIEIFVDKKCLNYIDGMTMDWSKQGLNEGFDFKNPNERDRCGCGESFRV